MGTMAFTTFLTAKKQFIFKAFLMAASIGSMGYIYATSVNNIGLFILFGFVITHSYSYQRGKSGPYITFLILLPSSRDSSLGGGTWCYDPGVRS